MILQNNQVPLQLSGPFGIISKFEEFMNTKVEYPKFEYLKLDKRTRDLMCEEILRAKESDNIYFSTRFNEIGQKNWIRLLRTAAEQFDEHWLAFQLEMAGAMKHLKPQKKPWDYTLEYEPDSSIGILATGQFNRFYMIAICRRALEDNEQFVIVYRAKQRREPREESQILEGTSRDANDLLQELRNKELCLKCEISRINSGLSLDYESLS